MKRWIPWMAAVWMMGCATPPYRPGTSAGYQDVLSSWTGKKSRDLIQAWGTPNKVQTLSNGSKKYTWAHMPFGPRLASSPDCATSAIIDSSGNVLSWSSKGSDCRLPYSEEELKKKHEALVAFCSTLSKNDRVRLTFYDDAENRATGRKFGKTYEGYFARLSTAADTVAISDSPPGLLQGYPMEYPLNLIEDISLIESRTTVTPPAPKSAVAAAPATIHVDCTSEGGSHLRLMAGDTASSFVIQSGHSLLHCRLDTLHLSCDLASGDHVTATLHPEDRDGVHINDCTIAF